MSEKEETKRERERDAARKLYEFMKEFAGK